MPHKYTDDQGNIVLSVSSTIPGVTFLPPGFTPTDAQDMSHGEFQKRVKDGDAKIANMPDPVADLTKTIQKLQADVETLKSKGK